MVLESLSPEAPVNIRDIVIAPAQRQESHAGFVPERDISEEDWEKLSALPGDMWKASYRSPHWYLTYLSTLKLLSPENFTKIANTQIPDAQQTWIEWLDSHSLGSGELTEAWVHTEEFCDNTIGHRILFPKKRRDFSGTKVTPQALEEAIKDEAINFAFLLATALKVDGLPAAIDRDFWERGVRETTEDTHLNIETLAHIKLTCPQWADEIRISQSQWQRQRQNLDSHRIKDAWLDFAIEAALLKILTANKVTISPEGEFIFEMPQPQPGFQSESPPLPEVRRF